MSKYMLFEDNHKKFRFLLIFTRKKPQEYFESHQLLSMRIICNTFLSRMAEKTLICQILLWHAVFFQHLKKHELDQYQFYGNRIGIPEHWSECSAEGCSCNNLDCHSGSWELDAFWIDSFWQIRRWSFEKTYDWSGKKVRIYLNKSSEPLKLSKW